MRNEDDYATSVQTVDDALLEKMRNRLRFERKLLEHLDSLIWLIAGLVVFFSIA